MRTPKTFRPWNPEQTLPLPPSSVEWLPANHMVFFLPDMAAELDLSIIYKEWELRQDRLDALRKTIMEPVFGQIKGAQGLDCFLLRGLEKVNGEWALMATTHNIGKLHKAALVAT